MFEVALTAACFANKNDLDGNTTGYDFLVFIVLKCPEICLCHLSGKPVCRMGLETPQITTLSARTIDTIR